jgi:alanine racemase
MHDNDRQYPIVGRVCMDMIMIDIGSSDDGRPIVVGDEVVLLGTGGPPLEQVAEWAGTISYEISTGIGSRVSRRYTGS